MRKINLVFLLLSLVAMEAASADNLTPEQKTALAAVDVRLAAVEALAAKIDDADYKTEVEKQIEDLKKRRLALEKNFDPALYETLMHSVISRYQVTALWLKPPPLPPPDELRPRLIVETDAGGDPDDEQSLVRLLVYASDFDIEGLIANRSQARERENKNPVRDGLGIVRAMVNAYGECYGNLIKHDQRFPNPEQLLARTVAGYDDVDDGVQLIIRAVDSPDPRPVWFSNWGTDRGSAESCLKRALDRVLRERGPVGYAMFKSKLRLCSADKFGDHTTKLDPPFPLWVETSHPAQGGVRWYHRFSQLTATAGGFDLERDVRTRHGPLGALYPTNTNMRQKEGDTMMFLYLLPTGMNEPQQPTWGSWAGRHGPHDEHPGKPYYWANQSDTRQGTTSRDNTLARWAAHLQNDFRARMDWCVADSFAKANHRPIAVLNGDHTHQIIELTAESGATVTLTAKQSSDPDGNPFKTTWFVYPEPGTYRGDIQLSAAEGLTTSFTVPTVSMPQTVHVVLQLEDDGQPALYAYRRAVIAMRPRE
jgi:hypothetical protein